MYHETNPQRFLSGGKHYCYSANSEIGNFLFTQLVPGLYELILLGHQPEIHIKSLAI